MQQIRLTMTKDDFKIEWNYVTFLFKSRLQIIKYTVKSPGGYSDTANLSQQEEFCIVLPKESVALVLE